MCRSQLLIDCGDTSSTSSPDMFMCSNTNIQNIQNKIYNIELHFVCVNELVPESGVLVECEDTSRTAFLDMFMYSKMCTNTKQTNSNPTPDFVYE